MDGRIALVTGAAHGIGAALARRLAGLGTRVVLADVDTAAGTDLARELGGLFVHCDVSQPSDSAHAVAAAVEAYGGLDLVALNAGVISGCTVGDDFDADRYRRAMSINVDGVATASLAGLAPQAPEPIYSAAKAAVVALVRALGPAWEAEGVRVNAICPGYADTAIVDPLRPLLAEAGVPLLHVEDVVDAFLAILAGGRTGECWYVQPGRPPEPFHFPRVPGIRTPTSQRG